eukprot:gene4493-8938_t
MNISWMHIFVQFAVICLVKLDVYGLEATWTPVDGDGDVPLSGKYRDSLRKLCVLIKSNKPLPPDLEKKRSVLTEQCRRLASDDKHLGGTTPITNFISKNRLSRIFYIGLGGSGLYIIWKYRQIVLDFILMILRGDKSSTSSIDEDILAQQMLRAREARLRRFAEAEIKEL